jgi:hypothetical protein
VLVLRLVRQQQPWRAIGDQRPAAPGELAEFADEAVDRPLRLLARPTPVVGLGVGTGLAEEQLGGERILVGVQQRQVGRRAKSGGEAHRLRAGSAELDAHQRPPVVLHGVVAHDEDRHVAALEQRQRGTAEDGLAHQAAAVRADHQQVRLQPLRQRGDLVARVAFQHVGADRRPAVAPQCLGEFGQPPADRLGVGLHLGAGEPGADLAQPARRQHGGHVQQCTVRGRQPRGALQRQRAGLREVGGGDDAFDRHGVLRAGAHSRTTPKRRSTAFSTSTARNLPSDRPRIRAHAPASSAVVWNSFCIVGS